MESLKKNRIIIIFGVMTLFFLWGSIGFKPSGTLDTKSEGTDTDYNSHANLDNGEELLKQLRSLNTYEFFTRDLFIFGKTAYPEYNITPKSVVGFTISSKITKDNNVVSFDGRYGSSSNKIQVKITLLKNNRIATSIEDTSTKLKIDNYLPSNTKMNNFIGSLPLQKQNYEIDYSTSDNTFNISIYDGNRATEQLALASLLADAGITDPNGINYRVTYALSGGDNEGMPAD